jgi:hypothetical protein
VGAATVALGVLTVALGVVAVAIGVVTVAVGAVTGSPGTVTVGTVGMGIVSASAWPPSRPAPARTVVTAANLIPQ